MSFRVHKDIEPYRLHKGTFASATGSPYGAFHIPSSIGSITHRPLDIIASDGVAEVCEGWEHVSVKVAIGQYTYTPTWDEMSFVKSMFWEDEDCVLQFHPPKSEYVNVHNDVLHLWHNKDKAIKLPPRNLIA